MHRFRTRRLSIAALVSFAAFCVVGVAAARSLWLSDAWADNSGNLIALEGGRLAYTHISALAYLPSGHLPSSMSPDRQTIEDAFFGFRAYKSAMPSPSGQIVPVFRAAMPLWPLLLLLLILPQRWLHAEPVNGQDFPIITDAKDGQA